MPADDDPMHFVIAFCSSVFFNKIQEIEQLMLTFKVPHIQSNTGII